MRSTLSSLVRNPVAVTLLILSSACMAGQIPGGEQQQGTGSPGGSGPKPPGNVGGGAPTGSGGMPGTAGPPPPAGPGELLPTRIRRLTNAELEASVAAVMGVPASFAAKLPADTRQSDFTTNAAQRVDPVLAAQLQAVARDLAPQAAPKLLATLGCSSGDPCAQRFVAEIAGRAFRRVPTDDEKRDLLLVFQAGAAGAAFVDGAALALQAVVQSPAFLHLSELGAGTPKAGVVTLAPHETASSLSFLLTGGPPDKALLDAAATGKLATAAEREAHARRLLGTASARHEVQRLVKEWLALDHLETTGKDATVYPKFEGLRASMEAEADAFIADVAFEEQGTLARLLSADYTIVDSKLASFYGVSGAGTGKRTSLMSSPRRGLLMQAGFLAVHASDHESAPVKRGTYILKKLLCTVMPAPSELNITIVPPAPDPKQTTRERFTIHAKDPACAGCHRAIDPLGFSLEGFDGMGAHRTTENGKPVDTTADLAAGNVSGPVRNGIEMVTKLVDSEDTQACFARNLFRFAAGQSGPAFEDKFLRDVWTPLPPARRQSFKELLVAYAASELFFTRKVQP